MSRRPRTDPLPDEQQILKYIRDFTRVQGWPPSRREIAETFGMSLSTTQELLVQMKEGGLLEIGPGARMLRPRAHAMKHRRDRYEQM